MMCTRPVIRSIRALNSRALGMTLGHSENGRLVVTHRRLLCSLGDHLKQKLDADFGQPDVTQFVPHNQVATGPTRQRT